MATLQFDTLNENRVRKEVRLDISRQQAEQFIANGMKAILELGIDGETANKLVGESFLKHIGFEPNCCAENFVVHTLD